MSLICQLMQDALTPTEEIDSAEWLRQYFYTHDGRAFSEAAVPWVTAPQGPCWAYDHIQFREIWLQWAARMFKTNFGLGMLLRRMDLQPSELMFATPDETNCKSVFGRLWKMIEHSPRLRDQAPISSRQSKTAVRLRRSVCHGAWPRGKSRLADKSIPAGHGNEIDKWEHQTTSTEGDPLPRFLKRGAEYPDRKFVLESTPGTKGASRIETGRLSSTDHRYYVPCPHCAKFQTLRFGDGESPGGLFWDKRSDGKNDRQLAKQTAHYVCKHCEGQIDDIHRPAMMNAGVWIPAGCEPDHERAHQAREMAPDDLSWMRGEPTMWGSEYGSQISVFYALFHGWGNCVYDFLTRKRTSQGLRSWTNEDKAETWEVVSRKQTWEKLGQRMIVNVEPAIVPGSHQLVTIGIDKQADHYVFAVLSWGVGHSSHILSYGTTADTQQLRQLVERKWETQDGRTMRASCSLIDSGFRPADVHRFIAECRKLKLPVRACRGSSRRLDTIYEQKTVGRRSANVGQLVVWVDTYATQDWLEERLHGIEATEPGGMSLYSGAIGEHQDILEQLLNDGLQESIDSRGYTQEEWNKIDQDVPNDLRDCVRYAYVGMLVATRGRPIREAAARSGSAKKTAVKKRHTQAVPNIIERPGGWLQGMTR